MAVAETLAFRAREVARSGISPGAAVLALAIPFLFLHIKYQPGVRVPLGSTHLGLEASDVAVVIVALVAAREGLRAGFAPLRPALPLWLASAALILWIFIRSGSLEHFVTAAKFSEYALLAVSAPLILRRRVDWEIVAAAVVAWSVAATCFGLLQFFGVDMADAWAAGRRQPSFLGHSDFAALSALALGIGLAAVLLARDRIGWAAVATGGAGLVLSGATAGLIGIAAGSAGFLYAVSRRRPLAVRDVAVSAVVLAVVAAGVLVLRAGDLENFLRFAHLKGKETQSAGIQTYSHHTLLAYVGYRIWRDHPVVGAGWQASTDPAVVDPELPAAHKKFPDVPPLAFPTRAHEWGVQNAYVQAAADLGLIGLVLWLAPFALALVLALRANAPPGAVAAFAILSAMGIWGGQGLVAGIPLDAMTWLGFGLAATAVAQRSQAPPQGK
ncbi:MAG: O-Antigen ligase [Gaiellaceae bacterium]|nr:O-Antigen ligase [Gaiellaceae bacterium]